jgi:hypothetical protein
LRFLAGEPNIFSRFDLKIEVTRTCRPAVPISTEAKTKQLGHVRIQEIPTRQGRVAISPTSPGSVQRAQPHRGGSVNLNAIFNNAGQITNLPTALGGGGGRFGFGALNAVRGNSQRILQIAAKLYF